MSKNLSGRPKTDSLGARIAQARREFAARERRDVTPPDAASLLGVSVPTYWRWERDERKPGRPALMAISMVFGCSLGFLLGEAGKGEPETPAEEEVPKNRPALKRQGRLPATDAELGKKPKDDAREA